LAETHKMNQLISSTTVQWKFIDRQETFEKKRQNTVFRIV